jgi:hypothetical protein
VILEVKPGRRISDTMRLDTSSGVAAGDQGDSATLQRRPKVKAEKKKDNQIVPLEGNDTMRTPCIESMKV